MSEEEMNAAIAERLGWTGPFEKGWLYGYGREGEDVWAFCGTDADGERDKLPNYCGDLNAMHEAENVLGNKLASYHTLLCDMHQGDDCKVGADVARQQRSRAISATAIQRAEAFLRTLGKWIE